ncbi:hypothetical protein OTU49_013313 [Cherax quadricarinatus]|uniref:Protein kinase domain-containing protein n=1 Tax=Cherax quadricarinatus TaxID=27406 RepID=A0AAW0VT05_CHEQU
MNTARREVELEAARHEALLETSRLKAGLEVARCAVEEAARNLAEEAASCVAEEAASCVAEEAAGCVAEEAASCVAEEAASCVAEEATSCVAEEATSCVDEQAASCVADVASSCVAQEATSCVDEQAASCVAEHSTSCVADVASSCVAQEATSCVDEQAASCVAEHSTSCVADVASSCVAEEASRSLLKELPKAVPSVEMSQNFSVCTFEELTQRFEQYPWQEVGSGVSSTVFRIDLEDRTVCAKRANNQVYKKYFKKEVAFLQRLDGAGGAPIPLCMSTDPAVLVMSYRGDTRLDDFLEKCSLSQSIHALIKLTNSLNEIHSRGVLHSDLKMDNVVIQNQDDPDNFTVNIIDYGLAHRLGANRKIFHTVSRHYPPEAYCPGKASRTFDIFSLGNIFFHTCSILMVKKCPKGLLPLAQSMMSESQMKRPNLKSIINRLTKILEGINDNDKEEDTSDDDLEMLEAMLCNVFKAPPQMFGVPPV